MPHLSDNILNLGREVWEINYINCMCKCKWRGREWEWKAELAYETSKNDARTNEWKNKRNEWHCQVIPTLPRVPINTFLRSRVFAQNVQWGNISNLEEGHDQNGNHYNKNFWKKKTIIQNQFDNGCARDDSMLQSEPLRLRSKWAPPFSPRTRGASSWSMSITWSPWLKK